MVEPRRLVAILAALIPIASGCNAILGIESHLVADASGSASEDAGVDGGLERAQGADAASGAACAFRMPNPVMTGLPNAATYAKTADGVTDKVTGLTWEDPLDNSLWTQEQAARYCERKGPAWHLPNRLELASLVDFTKAEPGPTINEIFKDTPGVEFWTSSRTADKRVTAAWFIEFELGSTHNRDVNARFRVRCVRGTPRCFTDRYQLQSGGLVRDAATGLTWQQNHAPEPVSWTEANNRCSALGLGWRLPSLTELQSIVDDSRQDVAIDGAVFPDTQDDFFWTSSTEAGNPRNAWIVAFQHGHTEPISMATTWWVRCVR